MVRRNFVKKLAGFLLECDIDASRSMTEWYKEIRKTAIIRNEFEMRPVKELTSNLMRVRCAWLRQSN